MEEQHRQIVKSSNHRSFERIGPTTIHRLHPTCAVKPALDAYSLLCHALHKTVHFLNRTRRPDRIREHAVVNIGSSVSKTSADINSLAGRMSVPILASEERPALPDQTETNSVYGRSSWMKASATPQLARIGLHCLATEAISGNHTDTSRGFADLLNKRSAHNSTIDCAVYCAIVCGAVY